MGRVMVAKTVVTTAFTCVTVGPSVAIGLSFPTLLLLGSEVGACIATGETIARSYEAANTEPPAFSQVPAPGDSGESTRFTLGSDS